MEARVEKARAIAVVERKIAETNAKIAADIERVQRELNAWREKVGALLELSDEELSAAEVPDLPRMNRYMLDSDLKRFNRQLLLIQATPRTTVVMTDGDM